MKMKEKFKLLLTLVLLIGGHSCEFSEFVENNIELSVPIACSRNVHCAVGQCCRSIDGKVVLSNFQFYPEIEWWRTQVGSNPGTCTSVLAQEGEKCDLFCMCDVGLLCAPNVLCRTCGNICMTTDVVNKLVQYYDSACNCVPSYHGPAGIPGFGRGSAKVGRTNTEETSDSGVKIENGMVHIPGFN